MADPTPSADDPREVLGVGGDATPDEIKLAAGVAKQQFNPDRYPDEQKRAAREQFYRVRAAEEALLSDADFDTLVAKIGTGSSAESPTGTRAAADRESPGGDEEPTGIDPYRGSPRLRTDADTVAVAEPVTVSVTTADEDEDEPPASWIDRLRVDVCRRSLDTRESEGGRGANAAEESGCVASGVSFDVDGEATVRPSDPGRYTVTVRRESDPPVTDPDSSDRSTETASGSDDEATVAFDAVRVERPRLHVDAETAAGVDPRVPAGRPVEVRVEGGETGSPLPRARVTAEHGADGTTVTATADATGRVSLALDPGHWTLSAKSPRVDDRTDDALASAERSVVVARETATERDAAGETAAWRERVLPAVCGAGVVAGVGGGTLAVYFGGLAAVPTALGGLLVAAVGVLGYASSVE